MAIPNNLYAIDPPAQRRDGALGFDGVPYLLPDREQGGLVERRERAEMPGLMELSRPMRYQPRYYIRPGPGTLLERERTHLDFRKETVPHRTLRQISHNLLRDIRHASTPVGETTC